MTAKSPISKRSSSGGRHQFTKCGCFAVFVCLATLGHVTMYYRLHHCQDCSPPTEWIDSMSLELGANNTHVEWSSDQPPPSEKSSPDVVEVQQQQQQLIDLQKQIPEPERQQNEQYNDTTTTVSLELGGNGTSTPLEWSSDQPPPPAKSSSDAVEVQQQPQMDDQQLIQEPELQQDEPYNEITTSISFNISTMETSAPTVMENSTNISIFAYDSSGVPFIPGRWMYNRTAWRPRPDSAFTVTFPVFVASLPKSGTTSIYAYFLCGGVRSVHTYCPFQVDRDKGQLRVGELVEGNIKHGYPPFHGCGTGVRERHGPVKVFSDTGHVKHNGSCYYPSISGLEGMYAAYPNMTIVLGVRNSTKWYQSIRKWGGGSLIQRWAHHCTFMPNKVNENEFVEFYEWHNRHIRKFAERRPSITLIEFSIDSETAGESLEYETNITSACWGHSRPTDSLLGQTMRLQKMRMKKKQQLLLKQKLAKNKNKKLTGLQILHRHFPKGSNDAGRVQIIN